MASMTRATKKKMEDQYPVNEAAQRFEAALRGAKLAQAQPFKGMIPKRPKLKRKLRKKTTASA